MAPPLLGIMTRRKKIKLKKLICHNGYYVDSKQYHSEHHYHRKRITLLSLWVPP